MGLEPSLEGAVHHTVAEALAGDTMTPVGGPGVVAGVTWPEGADAGPVPTPFVAVTVKV
jgi:hypothetical protein